ncbi:hypothetical protein YC2023_069417 [Brassica napus]
MVDTVVMFMAKAELFMYVDPSNYWLVRPKQDSGILNCPSRFGNLSDSSHIDDWSSPSKEFGGKRPCFGRTSPDFEVGVCIWVSVSDIFTSRI